MSSAAPPDNEDKVDLEGKSVTTETLEGGVTLKFVDGKAMIRVYLLDNTFHTLLIPPATTVKVFTISNMSAVYVSALSGLLLAGNNFLDRFFSKSCEGP